MDNFVKHLRAGTPIDELRVLFPIPMVQEVFRESHPNESWRLLCIPGCSTKWYLSYLEWIFDECAISLTHRIYDEYPFDYCHGFTYHVGVIDFFLARKAPTVRGLDGLLARNNLINHAKRLIDAGATPSYLSKDNSLATYYRIRLETRAAILAFLAARRRRNDIRQKVARELWEGIAQLIWERRWDFFVGTLRERRYKIK